MNQPSDGPEIKLEPNSLYITTQTIPSPGFQAFHWAIFVFDAQGTATTHQWAEINGETLAEQYQRHAIPSTAVSNNGSILAYFKVDGYEVAEDQDAFSRIFVDVFPTSFPTVRENREQGLTCRTWVLKVLRFMQEAGYISRPEPVENIEGTVKSLSAEQEQALIKALMTGKRPTPAVFTI